MPSRVPATIRDKLTFYHSMPAGDNPQLLTDVQVTSNSQNERDRTAIGLHVIVDERDDTQRLYGVTALPADTKRSAATGALPAQKVTKLTIICDTLTVRCRWWMPECEVIIFARHIEFTGEGCIDTSPAPWELPNARDAIGDTPGANGANGRPGGKVTIYARTVDTPSGSRLKRVVTDGGNGQGAGKGRNGDDGKTATAALTWLGDNYVDESRWTDSDILTTVKVKLEHHKGKKILGIRRIWHVAYFATVSDTIQGTNVPPTNGTDAIRPGDAGSGGAPGVLATNNPAFAALWSAKPGKAGKEAPRAVGGRAGSPTQSVYYECDYYHKFHVNWPGNYDDNSEKSEIKHTDYSTRDGNSYSGKAGNDADAVSIDLTETEANVWLHASLVPLLQNYVGACYLRGEEAEAKRLVDIYASVFLEPIPLKRGIWQQADTPYWRALQNEFATLQHRLANHLDFFGKPAGYTPMLSLASSFQLYRMEVDMALEVLMFAAWVGAKQSQQTEIVAAATEASRLIVKESAQIAERIQQAELRAQTLIQDAAALERAQNAVHAKLESEKTRLYNQASGDLARIGQIKFAVNLGAALLQVVPFGQPILGGVAAAGADAFDLLDEEPDDVLKKVKTRLTDTVKAYKDSAKETKDLVDKAKKEAQELAKASGKKLTVAELKDLAKKKPSAWSTAGKGLGEAAALANKAYQSVQLSQSEIEVQLAKLAAKDETWKALSKQIKDLIEQRAAVHTAMLEIGQQVGQGYADLASNYDALAVLNGEEASARARALSGNTFRILEGIRTRAHLAMTEALYNVVRAYESVLFKPVKVNWSLDTLAREINGLVGAKPMHELTDQELAARMNTLRTAFTQNLAEIRRTLIANLDLLYKQDNDVSFYIDSERQGAVLEALNNGFSAEIDTSRLGVIEPDWQHQRLAKITLETIEFEDGAKMPTRGDLNIIIEVSELGVVRDGARLFGLRLAAPAVMSFRYHFKTKTIDPPQQSEFSKDLMDLILGSQGTDIREKLAMPAAWTTLTFRANFNNIDGDAPAIKQLHFVMKESARKATNQIVLEARSSDGSSPIVMDGNPHVEIFRVVDRSGESVELSVDPKPANGAKFRQWEIRQAGRRRVATEPKLKVELNTHAKVEAQFERV